MVLSDRQIIKYCEKLDMVAPFNSQLVNPASLDLTLAYEIIEIHAGGIVDASKPDALTTHRTIRLQYGQKYLLQPGTFILASSMEYVKLPPELAAEVKLKSSTARAGIGHMFAGWIDPGFEGNITFELFSHVPVWLYPGKPICQIAFLIMSEVPEKPYSGRYQKQMGPTPARESKQLSFEFPGLDYAITRGYDPLGTETPEEFRRKRVFPGVNVQIRSGYVDAKPTWPTDEDLEELKKAVHKGYVSTDGQGNVAANMPPKAPDLDIDVNDSDNWY